MTLRIAYFGQAPFGRDVLVRLLDAGHEVVGVYAPPAGARPDPLAEEAEKRGLRLLRHASLRRRGAAIPERVAEHAALGADLNVLAFVTMILPPEIVDAPRHGSLCFPPPSLPEVPRRHAAGLADHARRERARRRRLPARRGRGHRADRGAEGRRRDRGPPHRR